MRNFFLKFTFLMFPILTFGQSKLFDQSSSDLSGDDLLSVAVDKNGNKWIGTSNKGLMMYNERDFIPFQKEGFDMIKGDYITPIFVDSKNRIWMAYSKPSDGITMLDGNVWYNYADKELNNISVIAISEDEKGNIYFGGANGVMIFDKKQWSKLALPKGEYIIRAMDISKKGVVAIGHNDGLLIRENNKWKSLTEENSELKLSVVRALKFTDNENLYIGYGGGFGDGGFSILKDNKWSHYNKTNSKVPDHMVRDIEIGNNGVIWMATNNGVIKIDGDTISPIYFRKGTFANVILDISLENDIVWIATNFGLIKYVP